jgi:O-antigen ligase
MVPLIATAAFLLLIAVLFALDRTPRERCSQALWLPVIWLSIACSRNVGEWLSLSSPVTAAGNRYLEGSPMDRAVLSGLIALGLVVLYCRAGRLLPLLRSNPAVIALFSYFLVSALWSDYPGVSAKRWFRGAGDLVMVLVLLTERDWMAALKQLFARIGFVLIPLSILFMRYFPNLGRSYGDWDGSQYWTGVATGKNGLGMLCLILGLAAWWRCVSCYHARRSGERTQKSALLAHGAVVTMALYLLLKADSKTSLACFVLSAGLVGAIRMSPHLRRPALLHVSVWTLILSSFAVLFLDVGGGALEAIGREKSLTGRTDVWSLVLSFVEDPILGEGYESFWLGNRLERIVAINGGINQAHNGYIEVYLNTGVVGLMFLTLLIAASYRRAAGGVRLDPELCSLKIGYFVVALIYNFTEGSFKMMSPVWISFLLTTMVRPRVLAREALPQPRLREGSMRQTQEAFLQVS